MKRNSIPMKLIYSILLTAALLFQIRVSAQDTTTEQTGPDNRPAKPAFESGLLFDQQTANIQQKNTLEFVIQHRFGTVENGLNKDLWGIWGPSNIRLGLNYTILKNVMVGWGATKYNKAQDFQVKYNFLHQTRSNSVPVSLTLYGNLEINCEPDAVFGPNYKFDHRYAYFSQLIITRRFSNRFSMQISPSFTHYNNVDSLYEHDKVGLSGAARYKISPQTSLMAAVDWPLKIQGIAEYKSFTDPPKPNICIGAEISTSTHSFHIYFGTSQGILPEEVMMNNHNDFFKRQFLIGLNITRLWNF